MMVDFIDMCRHDPTVRPQHFSVAPCSMILVVWGTPAIGRPSKSPRFNEHVHHWWSYAGPERSFAKWAITGAGGSLEAAKEMIAIETAAQDYILYTERAACS
jgi:hypothetical protein